MPKKDITGQRFRMLTALHATEKRDSNGSVIWHCRCDCGNEVDVSYSNLKYSKMQSCGCHRKAVGQQMAGRLVHVAGTSVELLKSRKTREDNSSGVTGVYLVKGKYRAEICFQGKLYRLGTYGTLDMAASVRKEAEKLLHEDFLAFYEKWRRKAEAEPEWAKENPISVEVEQQEDHSFTVRMLPEMNE